MALVLTPDQAAFITQVDADIHTDFLTGVTLPGGTPATMAKLPKYDEMKPEVQQQIRDGLKTALVPLLYRLLLFKPTVHVVQPTEYSNGFGPAGLSGYADLQYSKTLDGEVVLEGLSSLPGSPDGLTIFNLPDGFRPDSKRIFLVSSDDTAASIEISPSGDVSCRFSAGTGWISFDGVRFRAA